MQNKPNKYLAESSSYFLFHERDFYNMNYIYINILYQNIHRILMCSPEIMLICTLYIQGYPQRMRPTRRLYGVHYVSYHGSLEL